MEIWLEKKDCTGCGACKNVCPKGAIEMVQGDDGFKYPSINQNKCINCGLCKKTCPILGKAILDRLDTPLAFAGWSKDENTRFTSTSGGIFTELTKPIINKNGYVVGASYNEENLVEHKIANNFLELDNLKQSKYLQSDTKNIYQGTKKLLDNDKTVAFCGSPCQIAALYKFLKKDYPNLLTIEFICRGMNSPKAFKAWMSEIENRKRKKIKKVWFKYKGNGWKTSPKRTRVDFSDGTYQIYDDYKNTYMVGYLESNLYTRKCCSSCKFNTMPREADITLADFWGITKTLDDDKGTSLILVNSNKGLDYFEDIKENIFWQKRDINEIYKGNSCFTTPVKTNENSDKFLRELNDKNFSYLVKKYSKKTFFQRQKDKIKYYLKNVVKRN